MCMCLKDKKSDNFTFSLQWHVTAKCDQKCKHCYMYDSSTYKSEMENELTFEKCKQVIDDFVYSLKVLEREGNIVFGGGDPLLRKDFFDILRYAYDKKISPIAVMGNSYHLDKETAKRLKENGVSIYQISLDGMKDIHDLLRKPGSFEDALRGFNVLKEAGITTSCMFTVSKINMHQIIEVIRLASEAGIDSFQFDRLVPTGSGEKLKNETISPLDYKELLIDIDREYKRLKEKGSKTCFGYKDNLWGLVLDDNEIAEAIPILPQEYELIRGCVIGKAGFVVLADGSLMACRRLPLVVGKVPENSIIDIIHHSELLKYLKNTVENDLCKVVPGNKNCWGCPAEKYCVSGDFFTCDPQCWMSKLS